MKRGFDQILQQARKIQEQFQKIEEEAAQKTVEAQSGGGMVTCVVNGKQEILSIKISDEIWEERDKELLEDLIVAAVNEGLKKSREIIKEEIARVTGFVGQKIPFFPF